MKIFRRAGPGAKLAKDGWQRMPGSGTFFSDAGAGMESKRRLDAQEAALESLNVSRSNEHAKQLLAEQRSERCVFPLLGQLHHRTFGRRALHACSWNHGDRRLGSATRKTIETTVSPAVCQDLAGIAARRESKILGAENVLELSEEFPERGSTRRYAKAMRPICADRPRLFLHSFHPAAGRFRKSLRISPMH